MNFDEKETVISILNQPSAVHNDTILCADGSGGWNFFSKMIIFCISSNAIEDAGEAAVLGSSCFYCLRGVNS